MKRLITLFSVLFVVGNLASQTPTQSENYIRTTTYLSDDQTKKSETVQYFDGLGRPKQVVSVKATPQGKNLVVPIEYDALGRPSKDYLPVPTTTSDLGIQSVTGATVNSYYGVSNAYSEKKIEASPLARVTEVAHPGAEWSMASGHTQKMENDVNTTADQVKKYTVTNTWTNGIAVSSIPTVNGFYGDYQLIKNTVEDEDGNKSTEFKNSLGQTILARKFNGTTKVDTYYIYNNYGHLVYVISPKANQEITNNGNLVTQDILDQLCYQYQYDNKGRQIQKVLPGKGKEEFVYDQQNRLVASQDANQRQNGKWLFTRYDKFGRTVYTGEFNGGTRTAEQSNANGKGINNENRSTSAFTNKGQTIYYTQSAYPSAAITVYSVNYYDTYPGNGPAQPSTILSQTTLDYNVTMSVNGVNSKRSTQSLPTASLVKNIEDDNWTATHIWYDTTARAIGSYTKNHLGGFTRTESELDFAGVVKQSNTYHSRASATAEVEIHEEFEYDNQNRLKKHWHQVDSNPMVLLAENTYNELSQLTGKQVGDNLQEIDYTYNIRGWMTGINKEVIDDPIASGKLFSYDIRYQDPEYDYLSPGKYNGNISEVTWTTEGNNVTKKRYNYEYDELNRLVNAQFSNPDFTVPESHFNDEAVDYDLNGNITYLQRFARPFGGTSPDLIDELNYTYDGNKLVTLSDGSGNPTGYEGGGGNIDYDSNGNMTVMEDKSIDGIAYNHLNLPNALMAFGGERKLFYLYRADGVKLRKMHNVLTDINGSFSSYTEYIDGFHYLQTEGIAPSDINPFDYAYEQEAYIEEAFAEVGLNPILKFFPTTEGFYDYENNEYIYQYKDHLGNVRLSYNSAGEITDQNDYYPFGMNIPREEESIVGTASLYNYKYNGKELQETGMVAMDFRHYMSDVGRFTGADALAEMSPDWTPYRFAFNNPVMFSDPSGLYEVIEGGYRLTDPDEIASFMNFMNLNQSASFDMMGDHIQYGGLYELDNSIKLPEVMMVGKAGGGTGVGNPFGGQFGDYNFAVFSGKMNGWVEGMNEDYNRSTLYTAIADTKVGQSVTAFENFLFRDVVYSFAAGPLFNAGWRAVGGGKLLLNGFSKIISSNTNRVFWSGGNYVRDVAMNYAKANGAVTLEMTNVGRILSATSDGIGNVFGKNVSYKLMDPLWKVTSKAYATGTNGTVQVFHNATTGIRINSVWGQIEYGILNGRNPIIYNNVFLP